MNLISCDNVLSSSRRGPPLLPPSPWLRIYSSLQNICLVQAFRANALASLEIEALAYLDEYSAHTARNLFTSLGLLERTIDTLVTISYIVRMRSVANFYRLEIIVFDAYIDGRPLLTQSCPFAFPNVHVKILQNSGVS